MACLKNNYSLQNKQTDQQVSGISYSYNGDKAASNSIDETNSHTETQTAVSHNSVNYASQLPRSDHYFNMNYCADNQNNARTSYDAADWQNMHYNIPG